MRTKYKLVIGIGLLFGFIMILSVLSILKINSLASATENILLNNYKTLEYARGMLEALDKIQKEDGTFEVFEDYLVKHQNNISEPGEAELTKSLAEHYGKLKENPADSVAPGEVRNDLNLIMHLNMSAIQGKSTAAKEIAEDAVFWIGFAGTLCFLIAFALFVNLPGNIADPISELTESIRQIADKNYSQRVYFEGHNEFGELARSFNTMAEKLEEYNNSNLARLMMAIKRMEALIDKMHEPVMGLDEKSMIIFANEELQKITGLDKGGLIGKNAKELAITNDLIRNLLQPFPTAVRGDRKNTVSIFADGKESYFEREVLNISLESSTPQSQKLISQVIILRNVTSYKELDSAKTNFMATVSHEFKTPISSIKMSVQLLENEQTGKLNAEQKNLLEGIKDDADRMLKITGELLNMTQVESGNIQINVMPANLKDVVRYAINANKLQSEQKDVSIETSFPAELPNVMVDREKTAWVLTNLISNAIRYSYEHSKIYLDIVNSRNHIRVSVKDTGQGIAPEYKEKIFNRYFRVPGSRTEGTGLGLAISKEFIEAQGGRITVDSDLGSGSIFTITLNKAMQGKEYMRSK
jgi:NtrC-family two-component system sensor histidine kinase KinB